MPIVTAFMKLLRSNGFFSHLVSKYIVFHHSLEVMT